MSFINQNKNKTKKKKTDPITFIIYKKKIQKKLLSRIKII